MDDRRLAAFVARMAAFNLHPARTAHRAWLPAALRDAIEPRPLDRRVEPALSAWLLERVGLDEHDPASTDWVMREAWKRVFLLDRDSLVHLALTLSVAMHRPWLARIVDGARVREVKAAIGEDDWRFAIEDVPPDLFAHREPVFDVDRMSSDASVRMWEADGATTLLSLVPRACRAVRERARLFFDPALVDAEREAGAERTASAVDLIVRHLVPRRLPQWLWLF